MNEKIRSVKRPDLERAKKEAHRLLSHCRICPEDCRIDRFQSGKGRCKADGRARYFDAAIHYGDELEITPNYAISFSGCNLRCSYCITRKNSYYGYRGREVKPEELGGKIKEACSQEGVDKVHFLGGEPALHLVTLFELLAEVPAEMEVILNTNFCLSQEVIELLLPHVDWWLVDLKNGPGDCALRLSRIEKYFEIATENLDFLPSSEKVIVRHLLLPGHIDCCTLPILDWLSERQKRYRLSLRPHFVPPATGCKKYELGRFLEKGEIDRAQKAAEKRNLELIS